MRGKCRLIRFADDFVIIFEKKNDADRVMAVISKRWCHQRNNPRNTA